MSTQPVPVLTSQEYLTRERRAELKSEFYRGEMFAMAGASREHNLIVANLVGELRQALKQSKCEVYPSDMRVKVSATGLYTYPDVTIVCGKAEFEDSEFDTLLNPTILVEVLSNSTEGYDRGIKAAQYRKIDSLQHHVLVSQQRISVETYSRSENGNWMLNEISRLADSFRLSTLDISIPLGEVYRNITFTEPDLEAGSE